MFIAIIGTRLSGKATVEDYLVKYKGFTSVRLRHSARQGREGSPLDSGDAESAVSSTGSSLHSLEETNFLQVSPGSTSARFRPVSFLMMNSPTVPTFPPLSTALSEGNLKGDHMMFTGPEELLDYVTRYWQSDFVTLDLNTPLLLEKFMTRPFFTVVSVDAPILMRYQRSLRAASTEQSLQSFVLEHDQFYYGTTPSGKNDFSPARRALQNSTLHSLNRLVNMQVVNAFDTIESLRKYLEELDLTNPERLRPSWDTYFMQLAALASLRSNCMKRRVGAILVRNKRILSTGYNGTPRGLTNCNEGGCTRCNTASETADECVCLHAEENALLEAGRDRVGDGSVLYCNTCPCLKCTIKIIQTGVREVVYNLSYKVDDASAALFKEAGVTLRRHAPPPDS